MPESSRLVQVGTMLNLPTVRRAAGLLDGRHRSILKGNGQDFDDMALYSPGDDVNDIDWKSSARAGVPVIRRFVRETNLSVILGIDTGHSMSTMAPSGESKAEVALTVAGAISYLAHVRGDHVALAAGDAERMRYFPARGSRDHLELILRVVEHAMGLDSPPTDLQAIVRCILGTVNRRALVVLISDESRPTLEDEWAIRRLRIRHEVMFIAAADLNPLDPRIQDREVADVATPWELPDSFRGDKKLRASVTAATRERWNTATQVLQRQSVPYMRALGSQDALTGLIDLLGRLNRARH